MKALILNSGIGKRMGWHTLDKCKCMAELADGVTILDEQLSKLTACGITDICMTTGPFAADLESYSRSRHSGAAFTFVHNPLYDRTNYIYSIYLAREHLADDIILLHGDLVFDISVLRDIIASDKSVMVTDPAKPLPEKDFKAVISDGCIACISIDTFDSAVYAQPLYKLMKKDWLVWLDEICILCESGDTGVYAENAFNNVSSRVELYPLNIKGRICFEVDNEQDLSYAGKIYAGMIPEL